MTAIRVPDIPTPDPRTLDEPGRSLANALSGQYAVKRIIGRGGMGIVYLARDKRLERLVAIKTLPPQLASDVAVRERFLRETRMAGSLSHPNIVPIHGADEIDGHVFFVMRYIEGESLAARVRAHGRLEARVVCQYLRDVASALSHAHAHGVIHRDIKAENILIEKGTDRAVVTDFGIARLAEAQPLTATGQLLGTVYYVSPEQVSGDHVDARSDIYALGVVGYYALSGRFPFESDLASAVLVAHVTKTPVPVATIAPDTPPALAAALDRCLSKDPSQRFASADELIAAIDVAAATVGRPKSAAPAPAAAPAPTAPPRLISETEAHAVWHRAAEMQALTGVLPKVPVPPKVRDARADAARMSGFGLDEVRTAAGEAGIDERYVARAFAEHGLAPGAPTPMAPLTPPIPGRAWWTAGSRFRLERSVRLEGELPATAIPELVSVLTTTTGDSGQLFARSRELAWRLETFGRVLDASVSAEHGRTDVRVTVDVRRTLWRTIGTTLGLGFGMMMFGAAVEGDEGAAVGAVIGLWTIPFAVGYVWRRVRKAGQRAATLCELLALQVRARLSRD